jgi:hypothetical protein
MRAFPVVMPNLGGPFFREELEIMPRPEPGSAPTFPTQSSDPRLDIGPVIGSQRGFDGNPDPLHVVTPVPPIAPTGRGGRQPSLSGAQNAPGLTPRK